MPAATTLKKRLRKQPADALIIVGGCIAAISFVLSHTIENHSLIGWLGFTISAGFLFFGGNWLRLNRNEPNHASKEAAASFRKTRKTRVIFAIGGLVGSWMFYFLAASDEEDLEQLTVDLLKSGLIILAAGIFWKLKKRKKSKKKDKK